MVTTKTYTFSNVTADHTIAAAFERDALTVTLDAVVSSAVLAGFSGQAFTVRYKIGTGSWTNVTWNGTASDTWDTTADAHVFRTKSTQTASFQVPYGESITFEATAIPTGYSFSQWTDDIGPWDDSRNPATVNSTVDNMQVVANFLGETYTITASKTGDGTISPTGAVTVYRGEDKTFTMTASEHNHIASVTVDGTPIPLE